MSWKGTDFLTQLSIDGLVSTRLLFITEAPFRADGPEPLTGFSYANAFYAPVGLPVAGRYDDHGAIDDYSPSLVQQHLTQTFCRWAAPCPEDVDEWDFDRVLSEVREGNLSLRGWHFGSGSPDETRLWLETWWQAAPCVYGEPPATATDAKVCGVGFVLLAEFVYRRVVDSFTIKNHDGSTLTRASYQESLTRYLEALREYGRTSYPSENRLSGYDHLLAVRERTPELETLLKDNLVIEQMVFHRNFSSINDFIHDRIAHGATADDDEISRLVHDMVDFMFFSRCVEKLRRAWMPQAGKGSTNDDPELHAQLAREVLKLVGTS